MAQLFYICTFLPMGLFYAESDEGKTFVSVIYVPKLLELSDVQLF